VVPQKENAIVIDGEAVRTVVEENKAD